MELSPSKNGAISISPSKGVDGVSDIASDTTETTTDDVTDQDGVTDEDDTTTEEKQSPSTYHHEWRGRGKASKRDNGDERRNEYRRRGAYRADRSDDAEQRREEKRRKALMDYSDSYQFCWKILTDTISLFDSFPLVSPSLNRLNRYLTTLVHYALSARATSHKLLKRITEDRWQVGFCGVARGQNEEEDVVVNMEDTRKRSADLYIIFSVNGGQETKKILRDPVNFEPIWLLDCFVEGKFQDFKVSRCLDYMLHNGMDNYRTK